MAPFIILSIEQMVNQDDLTLEIYTSWWSHDKKITHKFVNRKILCQKLMDLYNEWVKDSKKCSEWTKDS